MHIYIYIYIYIYITLGKPVNPSKPHPHQHAYPNFEKISNFLPPDALKILIHSLVLPVFCFLCQRFSKLLKFKLENTLF